jgi:hypothetical protein
LGWLAERVRTRVQRGLISATVLITLTGYFPDEPMRGLTVQIGMLLLSWLPQVRLPRLLASLTHRLASASLWIYLTHWVVWPFALDALHLSRAGVAVLCLVVGIATGHAAARAESATLRRARSGGKQRVQQMARRLANHPIVARYSSAKAASSATKPP